MSQTWIDTIQGTSYFQISGDTADLDLATGATLGFEHRGAGTPPLEANGWVYIPNVQISAVPRNSSVIIDVTARPLDGSGPGFTVLLSANSQVVSSLAVSGDQLFIRTRYGVLAVPAHGCGHSACVPSWQAAYAAAAGNNVLGQIAIGRDAVFDLGQNGTLTAVSANGCRAFDCSPLWSTPPVAGAKGLAVTGDRVYVTAGSTLSVYDAAGCGAPTCTPLWTSTAPGALSLPSVVNNVVLAGAATGQLVAWNVNGCGAATCPVLWSQDQGGAVGPVSPIDHALVFAVGGTVRKLVVPAAP